jgi:hypothetical protein
MEARSAMINIRLARNIMAAVGGAIAGFIISSFVGYEVGIPLIIGFACIQAVVLCELFQNEERP